MLQFHDAAKDFSLGLWVVDISLYKKFPSIAVESAKISSLFIYQSYTWKFQIRFLPWLGLLGPSWPISIGGPRSNRCSGVKPEWGWKRRSSGQVKISNQCLRVGLTVGDPNHRRLKGEGRGRCADLAGRTTESTFSDASDRYSTASSTTLEGWFCGRTV